MPSFSEQKESVAGKQALELLKEKGRTLNLVAFFMKGVGKILQVSAIRAAEIKKQIGSPHAEVKISPK